MFIDMKTSDQQLHKILTLARAGYLDRAIKQLERLRRGKGREELWLILSGLCGQQGLMKQVVECCCNVLKLNPSNAVACSHMGSAWLAMNDKEQALGYLKKGVELQPNNPALRHNFAMLLRQLGRYELAIVQFSKSLELRPDAALTHYMIGTCYQAMGLLDRVEFHYKQALGNDETAVESLTNLGFHYTNMGEIDLARDYFNQALERRPTHSAAQGGLADLLVRMGEKDEAYNIVRKLLDAGSTSAGLLGVYSLLCREYGSRDEAISVSEDLMTDSHLASIDKSVLGYALGRMYDQAGDYDKAFEYYRVANEAAYGKFDEATHRKSTDNIIDVYNPEFYRGCYRSDRDYQQPVFIIGMPRSGTTLTEQILSRHSAVYAAGELSHINELSINEIPKMASNGAGYPAGVPGLSVEQLNMLADNYMDRLLPLSGGADRITDKMPANHRFVGLIRQIFPDSRIIHCMRDPLDTCLSIYFQNFQNFQPYANSLRNIAIVYDEYRRLMRHWTEVLDIQVLEVQYEDVVEDLETNARAIVEFCGLPWEDECLAFHKSRRLVKTASFNQVNQPIYKKSVARWKHYEKYLGEVQEILAPYVH